MRVNFLISLTYALLKCSYNSINSKKITNNLSTLNLCFQYICEGNPVIPGRAVPAAADGVCGGVGDVPGADGPHQPAGGGPAPCARRVRHVPRGGRGHRGHHPHRRDARHRRQGRQQHRSVLHSSVCIGLCVTSVF